MSSWTDKRPMSPHVQVWKWHVTMFGSIMHRATGCALYAGALLIVAWLFATAMGEDAYNAVSAVTGSIYGLIILFGFTLAVFFHALNGIRHLFWDAGTGFAPKFASMTGWLVIVLTFVGAVAAWLLTGLVPGVHILGGA